MPLLSIETGTINLSCLLPGPVHFFYLPCTVLTQAGVLLSPWRICSSIAVFFSYFLSFHFINHSSFLFFSIILSVIFFVISGYTAVITSILGNDFSRSAKDHYLKIETDVVLHGQLYDRPKVEGSSTILETGVTDPDDFRCRLYGVNLIRGSGSALIVLKAVATHKDSLPIRYHYVFHCTPTNEVPQTLEDVSKYGFYDWDSQAMKALGKKSNESSSK